MTCSDMYGLLAYWSLLSARALLRALDAVLDLLLGRSLAGGAVEERRRAREDFRRSAQVAKKTMELLERQLKNILFLFCAS